MLTPEDEARWRDGWTVQLLEATSDPGALFRARQEAREGMPAYDTDLDPFAYRAARIQPRDVLVQCPACEQRFRMHTNKVYCSKRCYNRAKSRRDRARIRERAA